MKKITRRKIDNNINLTDCPEVLSRIYNARGIKDDSDLDKRLEALLPYNKLKDIDKAVKRLHQALLNDERLLFVGDFDADGATSISVGVSAMRALGGKHVEYLVPNRFEFGYGLTPEIVELSLKWKPDVIITVDNGIASFDGVKAANEKGIDVIVTDHHLPADSLPEAFAIINPNQPDCEFESKVIAGVGVTFYVMLALRRHLVDNDFFNLKGVTPPNMASFLDLVALGTVADVVPLDKNNRILVWHGLRRIRAGLAKPGIKALFQVGKRDISFIRAPDLGFVAGPRLNAAGRLDDMSLGIECLLSQDENKALMYAKELDELNIERRKIEDEMKADALEVLKHLLLNEDKLPLGLSLYDKNWHQGVIGIVAGRLKEKYHRPVIVFAKGNEGEIKGSARSIPCVHIRDVLDSISKKHPELIKKFGGHAMAAGLSINESDFPQFKDAFALEVAALISKEDCVGEVVSDGELALKELNIDIARLLADAGPWGQAFPEPIFDNRFHLIEQRLLQGKHLKMTLQLEDSELLIDAIQFNVNSDEWPNHRAELVHCAYKLDINRYRNREKLQLMVEEMTAIS